MTTETQKNAQPQTTQNQKNIYTPPRLIIYGQVRSLTQSAVSNPSESSCENAMDGMVCGPFMAVGTSERIFKENIIKIGTHPLGMSLYLFDYKPEYRDIWGHGRQFGVMVDEVEKIMPEAVSVHLDGYKMINYTMLGIYRTSH